MNTLHQPKREIAVKDLPPVHGFGGGAPRVLVTVDMGEKAVKSLQEFADVTLNYNLANDETTLIQAMQGYDGVIVRSFTKMTDRVIEGLDKLRIIGRLGIGMDNVDLDAAKKKGVKVVNSAGAQEIGDSVCELAFGGLLALVRNIPFASQSTIEGRWEKKGCFSNALGDGVIAGKRLGVIGFGSIGRRMAEVAEALGMDVVVWSPSLESQDRMQGWLFPEAKPDLREHPRLVGKYKFAKLDDMLGAADVVSIHIPLVKGEGGSENLIGERELRLMKPNAVLMNFGRGGIIDEDALVEALREKRIYGAVIDTPSEEKTGSRFTERLRTEGLSSRVILTPHIGSQTAHAQEGAAKIIVEHLRDFFRQRNIQTS